MLNTKLDILKNVGNQIVAHKVVMKSKVTLFTVLAHITSLVVNN